MDVRSIYPHPELGFVEANDVRGAQRTVVCAGMVSIDPETFQPLHAGDMRAQLAKALDNLDRVLTAAGLTLAHVVRLNYYTTDVEGFLAALDVVVSRLTEADCHPASTLLGVNRLFLPELLIEIEATAMA